MHFGSSCVVGPALVALIAACGNQTAIVGERGQPIKNSGGQTKDTDGADDVDAGQWVPPVVVRKTVPSTPLERPPVTTATYQSSRVPPSGRSNSIAH